MSVTGEIKNLYSDKDKTRVLLPRTKTKAVSDENGTSLDILLRGKAPSGYGLGVGSAWIGDNVDIDTLVLPGWYSYSQDNISSNKPFTIADIFVLARGSGKTCIQVATSRSSIQSIKIRKMISNTWGDWMYINPPMELGVEYLTAEQYNGEPVYTKCLNIGALPNASRVALGSLSFPKRKTLISVTGVATHLDGHQAIAFPYKATTTQYGDVDLVAYTIGSQSITGYITTTVDMSEYTGVLTFKYTKSES